MPTYRYDYYIVPLPNDLFESNERMENQAILAARERAKLWCVPSEWTVKYLRSNAMDNIYQVRRKRGR